MAVAAGAVLHLVFPLFVAAPKVEGAALATMAINKLRGVVPCLAVSLGPESSARGHLSELARLTGARILGTAAALQTPSLDSLGEVSRVAATTKRTIVRARRAAG